MRDLNAARVGAMTGKLRGRRLGMESRSQGPVRIRRRLKRPESSECRLHPLPYVLRINRHNGYHLKTLNAICLSGCHFNASFHCTTGDFVPLWNQARLNRAVAQ